MLYTTIKVKEKEYKARLNTKAIVDLERKLGTNPINVLVAMGNNEGEVPNLEELLMLLHASLQAYEHGISMDDMYGLYDDYIDDGNTIIDLINLVVKIFQDSGLIPKVEEIEKNAKRGK